MLIETRMKTTTPMTEEVQTLLRQKTPSLVNEVYREEDGDTVVVATKDHAGQLLEANRVALNELPFMLTIIGLAFAGPDKTLMQGS
ncbi:hypothetical protein [Pseudooceanicola sp. MF1-13]|uniref:hypothetical protein n=1 Tax=Pseudooceanicola sp. MF1-13 TaxID=3379095 RepID=UPI0038912440